VGVFVGVAVDVLVEVRVGVGVRDAVRVAVLLGVWVLVGVEVGQMLPLLPAFTVTLLPSRNQTNAVFAVIVTANWFDPGWKVVGCPRLGGLGLKLLLAPIAIETAKLLGLS